MRISKKTIDRLRPDPEHETFLWDDRVRGFGLRLQPWREGADTAVGSYFVQYRVAGRTRRHAIGRVGTLTPERARSIAVDKLYEVAKGGDPSAERRRLRQGATVAELCDEFLREAEAGRILGRRRRPIRASTLAMDRSRIDRHIRPLVGNRLVTAITSTDIEHMQAAIASGKTAKAPNRDEHGRRIGRGGLTKGGAGVAGRCVATLSVVLEYARRRNHIERNPAYGVRKFQTSKQPRFLTIAQIGALGDAMRKAEAMGESATGLAAIRFILLTGVRRMEALGLEFGWVDRRTRCIRFPEAKSKSGAQMRPIGAAAIELLDQLTGHNNGCPHVFPADFGDGHFIGVPRILGRLAAAAGLEGVTVHSLRHSFASIAAELGFSELTIAGLLGHAARGVTQGYTHFAPDGALLGAADRTSCAIKAALDGAPRATVAVLHPVQAQV
jgi:integrase